MKNKKITPKNVAVAIFVALCVFSYFYVEARDARESSHSGYEQYEAKQQIKRNIEDEVARINYLNDASIPWGDYSDFIGETTMVTGPVADISILNDSNGSPSFIDLGEAYPSTDRFTIVIWEEHYDDVATVLNEISVNDIIYVEGCIEMYDGIPQIEVTDPSQINIL